MSRSRRDLARYVGYIAAGAVVAAPIALVVASWAPLDPPPRLSRADHENDSAPAAEKRRPRDKEQKQRPNRDDRKPKDSS